MNYSTILLLVLTASVGVSGIGGKAKAQDQYVSCEPGPDSRLSLSSAAGGVGIWSDAKPILSSQAPPATLAVTFIGSRQAPAPFIMTFDIELDPSAPAPDAIRGRLRIDGLDRTIGLVSSHYGNPSFLIVDEGDDWKAALAAGGGIEVTLLGGQGEPLMFYRWDMSAFRDGLDLLRRIEWTCPSAPAP